MNNGQAGDSAAEAATGVSIRVTLIGPMPPPIDGQSVVMSHMASQLAPHFAQLRVVDTAERTSARWLRPLVKVGRSVAAWRSIWGSDAVYLAVKADRGMWLTTATAVVANLAGARVFLHHHSYTYIRNRRPRMAALTRAAGANAHHIVLSRTMARDLRTVMPEIERTLVIGNACLVDSTLTELPLKADGSPLVLGHLSNLYLEKGIAEVVDLAVALHRSGSQVRLIVGGPTTEVESRRHLDRAAQELGDLFEYRGPLSGEAKRRFFDQVTHFIFPSRYAHESVPLVLFEAMAAGAVCVSTRHGSIPEQLDGTPSILADSTQSFTEEVLPVLISAKASTAASQKSRDAYRRALAESQRQLESFVRLLIQG